jgi:predicted RNase H-like HicB family nuclease
MRSYSAIIEITSTGYSAYIKELAGVITVGDELSEIKENIYEALDLYFEDQNHPYEVQFFVDLQQFFSYFKVLNKTAFAKYLGMNTSLFRQYTSGLAPLSDDKLHTISEGLQRLSFELNNLSLLSRTT